MSDCRGSREKIEGLEGKNYKPKDVWHTSVPFEGPRAHSLDDKVG